jgi:hypothetical protein
MSNVDSTNWNNGFLASDFLIAAKESLNLIATAESLDIEDIMPSVRAAIAMIEQAQHHVGQLEFNCDY